MHIAGCTFRHMGVLMYPHQDAHAVGIRRGREILIEHNFIEETGSAIEFWTSVGNPMRDMTVRYNFIKNIRVKSRTEGGGIVISGDNGETLGERTGFHFYGNIIMNAEGAGISSNNLDLVTLTNNVMHNCNVGIRLDSLQGRAVKAVVKNNIISNPKTAFIILVGAGNTLDWNNNLYTGPAVSSLWNPWGSFDAWRQANGTDANSILGNPGFKVASPTQAEDFQLTENSRAVDAGTDVNLKFDYMGTPVPNRLVPDIGAYELKHRAGVEDWSRLE